ncbi:hypothetical protein FPZ43_12145 [Mucilaginibacter pallidiroseus]|uniref:Uncharacterized protein n=1 Tax=Mucilaginibacter pallidiroseus TaxID=2599295 RepID=A0A563UCF3_9SPHI|nr:hypothetical protein [Mucilaginibacter pallidiroseus]TWR29006.1 hypothetical protein FPZ43_12145 [Mucilaginibacter pallidiroseus]
MKKYFFISMLALASCAGNAKKDGDTTANAGQDTTAVVTAAETPAQNMEYCFVHTDGTSAQDTTAVHLMIDNGKVSGDMNWMPKEKDSRKGTLSGTMQGDIIKATWTFMQEGMKDTMAVEFKLSSQQLAQKALVYNKTNGRQQTDAKSDYQVIYNLDNCNRFKSK